MLNRYGYHADATSTPPSLRVLTHVRGIERQPSSRVREVRETDALSRVKGVGQCRFTNHERPVMA